MNKNTFINVSNHPSVSWSVRQRENAETYGQIMDIPFPGVNLSVCIWRVSERLIGMRF